MSTLERTISHAEEQILDDIVRGELAIEQALVPDVEAGRRVVVQAYLPHVTKYNPRFNPMLDLVYAWPGGPLAVGDIVLCPKTPRGPGPFEAMVTDLDASRHPYQGPVKTIIEKVSA